jgi:ribonuclease P protein component
MLSKYHRLPALNIKEVMKHGVRSTGNGVILLTSNNETNVSRFSFIVSTKIDKRATVRNRIRRLMSESVRHLLPTFKKPIDCVFVARRNLSTLTIIEVQKIVVDLFMKAGLIES